MFLVGYAVPPFPRISTRPVVLVRAPFTRGSRNGFAILVERRIAIAAAFVARFFGKRRLFDRRFVNKRAPNRSGIHLLPIVRPISIGSPRFGVGRWWGLPGRAGRPWWSFKGFCDHLPTGSWRHWWWVRPLRRCQLHFARDLFEFTDLSLSLSIYVFIVSRTFRFYPNTQAWKFIRDNDNLDYLRFLDRYISTR